MPIIFIYFHLYLFIYDKSKNTKRLENGQEFIPTYGFGNMIILFAFFVLKSISFVI